MKKLQQLMAVGDDLTEGTTGGTPGPSETQINPDLLGLQGESEA